MIDGHVTPNNLSPPLATGKKKTAGDAGKKVERGAFLKVVGISFLFQKYNKIYVFWLRESPDWSPFVFISFLSFFIIATQTKGL